MPTLEHEPRLALPVSDGIVFVHFDKILRLQADGSYTRLYCVDGKRYVASKGLGHFESVLPPPLFLRCHHAHVINLSKVVKATRNGGFRAALITGVSVEVSRRRWRAFVSAFSANE